MKVDDLQLITGIDVPVPELGLTLHQPRVNEIARLQEHNYFLALSIFKMNKESLKIDNHEVTNWMLFTQALNQKIEGVANVRVLLSNFLQLFFIDKFNIGPRSLLLTNKDGVKSIEPEQFDELQQIILDLGGVHLLGDSKNEFNPASKRAAEIAEKMKKGRKKLAAMQPDNKAKGFIAKYISGVAALTSNSLEQVNNMTLFQLENILKRYLAWEEFELEIRKRLAGSKDDNKIEHWLAKDLSGSTSPQTADTSEFDQSGHFSV